MKKPNFPIFLNLANIYKNFHNIILIITKIKLYQIFTMNICLNVLNNRHLPNLMVNIVIVIHFIVIMTNNKDAQNNMVSKTKKTYYKIKNK